MFFSLPMKTGDLSFLHTVSLHLFLKKTHFKWNIIFLSCRNTYYFLKTCSFILGKWPSGGRTESFEDVLTPGRECVCKLPFSYSQISIKGRFNKKVETRAPSATVTHQTLNKCVCDFLYSSKRVQKKIQLPRFNIQILNHSVFWTKLFITVLENISW